MATTDLVRPAPARPSRRGIRWALLVGLAVVVALAVTVPFLASGDEDPGGATGSGVAASETRTLPAFTAIDVAGTNLLTVRVGEPQQVVVRADDNLLDRVVTQVRAGVLVVSDRGSFTTRSPMSVVVTMRSLRSATLSGTGEVDVTGVAAKTFTARLSGTGLLQVSGRAERVAASVAGDGAVRLGSLFARDATATVGGTGSITIHVTGSLHATVSGTGAIIYTGDPASVTRDITGDGTITRS
ncbi:MAG TPA: head GIN domain-containing protein [Mycobacteriales bacterium]